MTEIEQHLKNMIGIRSKFIQQHCTDEELKTLDAMVEVLTRAKRTAGENAYNIDAEPPDEAQEDISEPTAPEDTPEPETQHSVNLGPLTLDELKQMDGQKIRVEQIGIKPEDDWSGIGYLSLEHFGIICNGERRTCHNLFMDWMDKRVFKEIRAYENNPEEG